MKKYWLSLGLLCVIGIGSIGIFADPISEWIDTIQNDTDVESEQRSWDEEQLELEEVAERGAVIEQHLETIDENISLYDTMRQALEVSVENPVDYNNILYNYEYLKQGFHLSDAEMEYIATLLIRGYEPMTVMDLAYFWLDTNEPIDIIEEMYLLKGRYRGDTWIENAFNEVTNDKCGVLTEEDVEEYQKQGISVADIISANKLCRKGVLTIRDILSLRIEGKTFAEITAIIHGDDPSELPAQLQSNTAVVISDTEEAAKEEVPAQDMICAAVLSQMEEVPIAEYYEKALQGESMEAALEQKEAELSESIMNQLRSEGLLKASTAEERETYLAKEAVRDEE